MLLVLKLGNKRSNTCKVYFLSRICSDLLIKTITELLIRDLSIKKCIHTHLYASCFVYSYFKQPPKFKKYSNNNNNNNSGGGGDDDDDNDINNDIDNENNNNNTNNYNEK